MKIFPLSVLGCDEAVPMLANFERLAKFLKMPYFPISPFFPLLPFPFNLASRPIAWKMQLMKEMKYEKSNDRDELENTTKAISRRLEGEIQAELNRSLRHRTKS